ncbi:MAG: hypothetical protein DHS20C17_27300 [Cyclobacteriaceae bacterium]|nr:MAG: hypothetical protein DHS20C17_27300 [Cyclobacteriaceae bacterium]
MNTVQIQPERILRESNRSNTDRPAVSRQPKATLDFNSWELDTLIDYILNTHHYFVWVNLPVIKEFALKTARNQGEAYPQTIEVNRQFKELASLIEDHLITQEYKVFPSIRQLAYAGRDAKWIELDNLDYLLQNLEAEHQCFKSKLNSIVSLLSSTKVARQPDSLPNALLGKLKAFERDFIKLVNLESAFLFPKVLQLQRNI